MKSDHQRRVEQFMALAGQEVKTVPEIPNIVVRRLRAKIILEEALETIRGLGLDPTLTLGIGRGVSIDIDRAEFLPMEKGPDLVDIADGCADLRVVTTGTLSACGIADFELEREVDLANLRKFGTGSYRREDGKWMKPPDFVPPDVARVLLEQGWVA